jgi:predicted CoA-binding protein
MARAEIREADEHPELIAKLEDRSYKARVERAVVYHVAAFDWNCSQHITPRWTENELTPMINEMRDRIQRLEEENDKLRNEIGDKAAMAEPPDSGTTTEMQGLGPMTIQDKIESFLAGTRFAVVGASRNRAKYGNKVLRAYQQNNLEVFPINPSADEVEGLRAYPDLSSLPGSVDGVSIVTPPEITRQAIEQAVQLGVKNIWLQPGAESQAAINHAERADVNLLAGGPCVLVALGYRED